MIFIFFKMIYYLKHNEINLEKWDRCINNSINGRVYALSWYLDTVCKNWDALVEDDYNSVMPITWRKKYGIHYLFQPHFTQQLGIFSSKNLSPDEIKIFLNAIPEKFKFAEICLNIENSSVLIDENEEGFLNKKAGFDLFDSNSLAAIKYEKKINCELDLSQPYGNIFKNYSENTRRNIKKAEERKVKIMSEKISIGSVIEIFKNNKGKEFPHLKTEYFDILKNLILLAEEKKMLHIIGSFNNENKLIAGMVFLVYRKRAIFLFSASNQLAKESGAIFLLIDRYISEHCEKQSILDFEGSNNLNLARFYKSFGAKEYVFLQLKKNNLPKYIRWLKK